jgi:hypothetical protein
LDKEIEMKKNHDNRLALAVLAFGTELVRLAIKVIELLGMTSNYEVPLAKEMGNAVSTQTRHMGFRSY